MQTIPAAQKVQQNGASANGSHPSQEVKQKFVLLRFNEGVENGKKGWHSWKCQQDVREGRVLHVLEGEKKPLNSGEIWLCAEVREEKREGGYPRIIVTLVEHMAFKLGEKVVCDFKKGPQNSPIPDWVAQVWKNGICTKYVPDLKGVLPSKEISIWHCETVTSLSFNWERSYRKIAVRLINPA
ncbi:MAG: hypothetical protein AAB587_01420 [Patescibacteria group bacterium]